MVLVAAQPTLCSSLYRYIYSTMHVAEFTVAEASWVTGLSVKAVKEAIEDAAVPVRIVRAGGVRGRFVPYASALPATSSAG